MDDIEQVLLVIRECLVYKLPPRQSNKGYRAADWDLDKPLWTGRLKVITVGRRCEIQLLDSTGKLFASAPIREDTNKAVESVIDSSRYFVLRVENEGRHAYLGMGFQERTDAFDFNVALQEYTKSLKKEAQSSEPYVPKHDLKMKEGQTIRLNIKKKDPAPDADEPKKGAPMVSLNAGAFTAAAPSSGTAPAANPFAAPAAPNPFASPGSAAPAADPFAPAPAAGGAEWGSFASASTGSAASSNSSSAAGGGDSWVAF